MDHESLEYVDMNDGLLEYKMEFFFVNMVAGNVGHIERVGNLWEMEKVGN